MRNAAIHFTPGDLTKRHEVRTKRILRRQPIQETPRIARALSDESRRNQKSKIAVRLVEAGPDVTEQD
jgi:hypothetical protein